MLLCGQTQEAGPHARSQNKMPPNGSYRVRNRSNQMGTIGRCVGEREHRLHEPKASIRPATRIVHPIWAYQHGI
jgi:hypothetical protein